MSCLAIASAANIGIKLTRNDCVKSTLLPGERLETDLWRAEILDRALEAGAKEGSLPEHLKNRLKIRAAGVWAALAHQLARRSKSDPAAVLKAGQRAEAELAGVDNTSPLVGEGLGEREMPLQNHQHFGIKWTMAGKETS